MCLSRRPAGSLAVARTPSPFRRVLLLALIPAVLCSIPAFATTVKRLSLEEVTAAADHIVRGKVESSRSFWQGKQIMTEVTLSVARTYKGPARSRQTILQIGGRVESPVPLEMVVPGTPLQRVGDEAFFFLEPAGPDRKIIVGLFQGHVPVRRDAAGEYVQYGGKRLHPAEFEETIRRAVAAQLHGPGDGR